MTGWEKMRITFFATVLAVMPLAAQGQDYFAGVAAYNRGDYAAALQEWQPLAEQGLADAQFALGVVYLDGHGVLQNNAEAMRWYRLAAEQGFGNAQFALGVVYLDG